MRHIQGLLARGSHSRSSVKPDDEYIQAREFYTQDLSEQERVNLQANTAAALSKVSKPDIVVRYLICMYKVHPQLAEGILSQTLPLMPQGKAPPGLTIAAIKRLSDSMPHASIPEQGYVPRPVQL